MEVVTTGESSTRKRHDFVRTKTHDVFNPVVQYLTDHPIHLIQSQSDGKGRKSIQGKQSQGF